MNNRAQGLRIGIALGGGGARGWAHIGVLRALLKAGLEPQIVAGTSIGAIVGGAYAAGRLDALDAFARGVDRRETWRLIDLNNSVGGGLVLGERIAQKLAEIIGPQPIESFPKRFVAVATELETGHELWLDKGDPVVAIRASYAMPGIFLPVPFEGRHLVDGGVTNPVPVSVCRAMGAQFVIAVSIPAGSLTSRRVARGEPTMASWWQSAAAAFREPERLVARQLFGEKPGAMTAASVSAAALNLVLDTIGRARLAIDQPDIVIGPAVSEIALLEFDRADECIRLGEAAVEKALPQIEAAIAETSKSRFGANSDVAQPIPGP